MNLTRTKVHQYTIKCKLILGMYSYEETFIVKWAAAAYPGAYYLCPSVLQCPVCLWSLCNTLGHKSQSIRREATDEQLPVSTVHGDQHIVNLAVLLASTKCHAIQDNKVYVVNMGPTWVLSAPRGPHSLAIRDTVKSSASQGLCTWFVFVLLYCW